MANIAVHKLSFLDLWRNYPKDPPCVDSRGGIPKNWENQCAVRVGVALEKSGVTFGSLKSAERCPTGPVLGGMVGSAQVLANWLKQQPFAGCPRPLVVPGSNWEVTVKSKTGIVFFRDYWRRHGETRGTGSGDHIDLWNRTTLTPSLQSFLRFTIGIDHFPNLNPFSRAPDNENIYSDLGKSREVWFWQIF